MEEIGVKNKLVQKCEFNWRGMPTIFWGVNFGRVFVLFFFGGGGAEALKKQGRKTCGKTLLTNLLRNVQAILLNFARPK